MTINSSTRIFKENGQGKEPTKGKSKGKGKCQEGKGQGGRLCYICDSAHHLSWQCLSQIWTEQQPHADGAEHYDISDDGPASAPLYGIMLSSLELAGVEEKEESETITFGVESAAAAIVMKRCRCNDYPIDENLAQE